MGNGGFTLHCEGVWFPQVAEGVLALGRSEKFMDLNLSEAKENWKVCISQLFNSPQMNTDEYHCSLTFTWVDTG